MSGRLWTCVWTWRASLSGGQEAYFYPDTDEVIIIEVIKMDFRRGRDRGLIEVNVNHENALNAIRIKYPRCMTGSRGRTGLLQVLGKDANGLMDATRNKVPRAGTAHGDHGKGYYIKIVCKEVIVDVESNVLSASVPPSSTTSSSVATGRDVPQRPAVEVLNVDE